MREYILTEAEKTIIKRYLDNGEKLNNFDTLLHRVKNMQGITSDIELIAKFLAQINKTKN